MSAESNYLMNAWYVAALSSEIDAEAIFTRRILEMGILFYRKTNGEVVALRDRCPHRFLPLSKGTRNGDDIVCHYHGLQFDAGGHCTLNPHGNGRIREGSLVQSFPVVECNGFVWIWPGDPASADPRKILDCNVLSENPADSTFHIYMHNEASAQLLTDNIMDLSHIDHLHGPIINTGGQLSPLIPNVKEVGDDVEIRWDWDADPAFLLLAQHLQQPEAPARQFFCVHWRAPSNMHLQVGALQGDGDYHNDGVVLYDFHLMTPETTTTSHYFFASTRNYLQNDPVYNEQHKAGLGEAFLTEDKPVIERQQAEIGEVDLFELDPIILSSDAGAVRVRRKLKALLEAECEGR